VSVVAVLLVFGRGLAWAEGRAQDPLACYEETRQVCRGQEEDLETCLAERGDRLSNSCRDQIKAAMAMVEDESGPGACVKDVKRSCPRLEADDLSRCIVEKQADFSLPCQKYLQQLSSH
jgi:hypothetical protein